jgi:FkbH-like protein
MKAHLPEVAVVRFPSDMTKPEQFLRRLKEYFFADIGSTREDRLRSADYRRRAVAENLRKTFADTGVYLTDLELQVHPGTAKSQDIERLAQMAGKTNQFNATTIRRTSDDFARLMESDEKRIFVFSTRDRFGEQGLVCYVIVDIPSKRITDFVMSCRAMGRTLEHFACRHIEEKLGFLPEIDFVQTAKNAPFKEFLATISSRPKTYYREYSPLS